MKRLLFLFVAVAALTQAVAQDLQWAMRTNNSEYVLIQDADYLLAADDQPTFAIVLKNGSIVENVSKVTFEEVSSVTSVAAQVEIAVFPNPVAEMLTITGVPEGMRVTILALDGTVVSQAQSVGDSLNIYVGNLAAGCYLIQTENSVVKFLKK